ncbi:MAG TPA: hypothetical protein VKV26_12310 [Dehalococcoidia bacterium]|nr:hypothetical protein [Dehalococcoidia bacterium]
MRLLLIYLFAVVGVGLFSDRLDRRLYAVVLAGALLTTALYFFTRRFMT